MADQIGADAETPALSNVPIADLMGGARCDEATIADGSFGASPHRPRRGST